MIDYSLYQTELNCKTVIVNCVDRVFSFINDVLFSTSLWFMLQIVNFILTFSIHDCLCIELGRPKEAKEGRQEDHHWRYRSCWRWYHGRCHLRTYFLYYYLLFRFNHHLLTFSLGKVLARSHQGRRKAWKLRRRRQDHQRQDQDHCYCWHQVYQEIR